MTILKFNIFLPISNRLLENFIADYSISKVKPTANYLLFVIPIRLVDFHLCLLRVFLNQNPPYFLVAHKI